jgi:hypothetical protein
MKNNVKGKRPEKKKKRRTPVGALLWGMMGVFTLAVTISLRWKRKCLTQIFPLWNVQILHPDAFAQPATPRHFSVSPM